MATGKKAAKQGLFAKFRHWYDSYQGKKVTNIIYCAGASVVIIGALFKILHLTGANQVLMVGMCTEAFLFLIGTLERPYPEFHWDNVFPQLLEYGANPELLEEKARQPRPNLLGSGYTGGSPIGQNYPTNVSGTTTAPGGAEDAQQVVVGKVPTLKEEDWKSLKEGITKLAGTATQLSELGKIAQTGLRLGEKLAAAEAATDSYAAATTYLAQNYAQIHGDMQQVVEETRAYKQGVEQVGQKLASLNSVYELQLQTVNAQMEAHKLAVASAKEAAEAQVAFVNGAKQLEKQVADLNAIYGNMLNALA